MKSLSLPRRLARLAWLVAAVGACASVARYDGQVYRGQGLVFRTGPVPPEWARIEATQGLLAFRGEREQATVLLNGRCGRDGDDVPLQALAAHLFIQFTERQVDEEEVVPFDGREALRVVMTAKLDGVARRFEAVVLKKDGCVYDFVLVSPPETFAAARPGFDAFVQGFHTGER